MVDGAGAQRKTYTRHRADITGADVADYTPLLLCIKPRQAVKIAAGLKFNFGIFVSGSVGFTAYKPPPGLPLPRGVRMAS